MSVALGVSGWLLAVTGIGAAAIARIRLSRQADAVARASHEVRGPLTAIGLGLELAARVRRLPLTRLRAIELELGRAAVALDDLSAVRNPRPGAQAAPVEVGQLVASSVEAWRPVAAAQGAAIVFDAPARPLLVAGERLRLAQAVGNLLANAIEHGAGDIEVSARAAGGVVHIEVGDDGPGLPAPIEQLIGDRSRRDRGGRGQGMSIVSRIAAAHRGRLRTGPSDRGARVVLELPAARGVDALVVR